MPHAVAAAHLAVAARLGAVSGGTSQLRRGKKNPRVIFQMQAKPFVPVARSTHRLLSDSQPLTKGHLA